MNWRLWSMIESKSSASRNRIRSRSLKSRWANTRRWLPKWPDLRIELINLRSRIWSWLKTTNKIKSRIKVLSWPLTNSIGLLNCSTLVRNSPNFISALKISSQLPVFMSFVTTKEQLYRYASLTMKACLDFILLNLGRSAKTLAILMECPFISNFKPMVVSARSNHKARHITTEIRECWRRRQMETYSKFMIVRMSVTTMTHTSGQATLIVRKRCAILT